MTKPRSLDLAPGRRVLLLVAALAVGGCGAYSNAVTLAPSPAPDSIVFRISGANGPPTPARNVFGLSVVQCGTERSHWTIAASGTTTMPDLVVFGRPIEGFEVRTPAEPLAPGCYDVLVSGAKPLRITVGQDGRATTAP
jgi:hypothetical protein